MCHGAAGARACMRLRMLSGGTAWRHPTCTSWCARHMSSRPLTALNSLATLPPNSQPASATGATRAVAAQAAAWCAQQALARRDLVRAHWGQRAAATHLRRAATPPSCQCPQGLMIHFDCACKKGGLPSGHVWSLFATRALLSGIAEWKLVKRIPAESMGHEINSRCVRISQWD